MGYDGYDLSWTMPQCVLCLRLIGVAIDVYDGGRPKEKLSKNEAVQAPLPPIPDQYIPLMKYAPLTSVECERVFR